MGEMQTDCINGLREELRDERKKVVAADRKVAKQAVLIEALRILEKVLDFRLTRGGDGYLMPTGNEITALENVKAAQTELDKERS